MCTILDSEEGLHEGAVRSRREVLCMLAGDAPSFRQCFASVSPLFRHCFANVSPSFRHAAILRLAVLHVLAMSISSACESGRAGIPAWSVPLQYVRGLAIVGALCGIEEWCTVHSQQIK